MISDGKLFLCDNTKNKSAIFFPNEISSQNQPDFVTLSEMMQINLNLAKKSIDAVLTKSASQKSTVIQGASLINVGFVKEGRS